MNHLESAAVSPEPRSLSQSSLVQKIGHASTLATALLVGCVPGSQETESTSPSPEVSASGSAPNRTDFFAEKDARLEQLRERQEFEKVRSQRRELADLKDKEIVEPRQKIMKEYLEQKKDEVAGLLLGELGITAESFEAEWSFEREGAMMKVELHISLPKESYTQPSVNITVYLDGEGVREPEKCYVHCYEVKQMKTDEPKDPVIVTRFFEDLFTTFPGAKVDIPPRAEAQSPDDFLE